MLELAPESAYLLGVVTCGLACIFAGTPFLLYKPVHRCHKAPRGTHSHTNSTPRTRPPPKLNRLPSSTTSQARPPPKLDHLPSSTPPKAQPPPDLGRLTRHPMLLHLAHISSQLLYHVFHL